MCAEVCARTLEIVDILRIAETQEIGLEGNPTTCENRLDNNLISPSQILL